jgi:hypothetical protein
MCFHLTMGMELEGIAVPQQYIVSVIMSLNVANANVLIVSGLGPSA